MNKQTTKRRHESVQTYTQYVHTQPSRHHRKSNEDVFGFRA